MAASRHAGSHAIEDAWNVALRCVIVDDNAFFLETAADVLGREGLDVVGVASTSAEAMRLVTELQPDVVLVDVDLGDEDGLELARRVTESAAAAPKVILISTHAEDDLAQLIAVNPAIGFIAKARLSAEAVFDLIERAA
jgi:CheY-like chemotaxis protein